MLLVTLGACLLGNMLTGKGILRTGYGNKEGAVYRSERSSMKRSVNKDI